jgi:hypothetical protein
LGSRNESPELGFKGRERSGEVGKSGKRGRVKCGKISELSKNRRIIYVNISSARNELRTFFFSTFARHFCTMRSVSYNIVAFVSQKLSAKKKHSFYKIINSKECFSLLITRLFFPKEIERERDTLRDTKRKRKNNYRHHHLTTTYVPTVVYLQEKIFV